MIEIEIDNKPLQVQQGSMIIEAADRAGIYIPRFCYHKKLSIAANCRMCLVEVEKAPKPLPACATPVTAGMKVYTCSAKAKDAQRSVMEFLLINHPLDCPICDQGGECELQDLSMGYGADISRFNEGKRSVVDEDLGPLIETEMTRCIQCTRCVRFGTEVAGMRELGAVGRGEHMEIATYIKHSMESELSGNIIDLCPVGALTSKPFRFKARAWELKQSVSIAPHDCVGSNIFVHTRNQNVMRVVPRENETLNETWLADRDRFSYAGLLNDDRLQKPMIKVKGEWRETDWPTALESAATALRMILVEQATNQVAALASPSATTEELYLLQKLMRGLGCQSVDHRLHQTDVADQYDAPLYPGLPIKFAAIETQDTIVLIGSNIQREQPIAGHRVRKAVLRGAKVLSINVVDYTVNFAQTDKIIIAPTEMVHVLAGIAKALTTLNSAAQLSAEAVTLLKDIQPTEKELAFAQHLVQEQKTLILLGAIAHNHPAAATLRSLAQLIAQLTNATMGYLTEGANSAGAWLAGAIPHRFAADVLVEQPGLAAHAALQAKLRAYLLFGIEPQLDCADPHQAIEALAQADFVLVFSAFKNPIYLQHADVILPIAAFGETEGSFVNVEGRWQDFPAAVTPPGDARPGWKVLRVLANQLQIDGFDYVTAKQVRDELQQLLATITSKENWWCPPQLPAAPAANDAKQVMRITEWPIYAIDSLVRRSGPLQQSATNHPVAIFMNANLAKHLLVHEGMEVTALQQEASARLPVSIDPSIPDNCVWIPAGCEETATLGAAFGAVKIQI